MGAETRCTASMQMVPFNGAKAEPPPQVQQSWAPSHLTQLFTLLQLLLQLKHPAKEGEQKRLFFLSYDQAPNSAGLAEKGIKRATKYKSKSRRGGKAGARDSPPVPGHLGQPRQGEGVLQAFWDAPSPWLSPRC